MRTQLRRLAYVFSLGSAVGFSLLAGGAARGETETSYTAGSDEGVAQYTAWSAGSDLTTDAQLTSTSSALASAVRGSDACGNACASAACAGAGCATCGGASCCGSGCGSACCGTSCCGSCGSSCCGGCGGGRLFGLFAPSDRCYQDFVSPISNTLFFEDPRTLTEIKPIFIEHHFPRSQPVLQGGDAQVIAVQFRLALTQRLSIIATKDGWIDINSPGVGNRDGFADIAAGLKYNLIRRPQQQFLLSVGATYEIPWGQEEVFQSRGDGEFHLFSSSAMRLADWLFWMSGAGFRLPSDHNLGSQMFYWSNSLAYKFADGARPSTGWYAMWETNWFHWLRSGNVLPVDFEGTDLINFGSTDVAGNDIVTMLAGLKYKPKPRVEYGTGWEFLVSDRGDLYGHRVYVHGIWRY